MAVGALFLSLMGLYLLTYSGKLHSIDEFALFGVADSIAQRGQLDINALWWAQKSSGFPPGVAGPDGQLYSKMAPGMSLAALPLVWLGHRLALGAISVALLANAFITAATFAVLGLYLIDLGLATRRAVTVAALAGTTTLAWPYARFLFAAPLLSFGLVMALFYSRRRKPGLAGLGLAIALLTRLETVVALPWLLGYVWRRPPPAGHRRHKAWNPLLRFALPVVLAGLALLGYNWLRFGSLSNTGYSGELRFAFQPQALVTLLWGPGLGFFIYAPALLVGLAGLRRSFRRWPPETILSLGLATSLWAFYGSWHAWDGGWGWGPRFLVPLVPLLCLPLAALLDGPSPWRWLIYPTALAGFLINAAGAAVDFNDYFITRDLIHTIDIRRLADWPPYAQADLFRQGYRDLAGLGATWPALILLLLGGVGLALSLFRRQRALDKPAARSNRAAAATGWPLPPFLLALAVSLPIAAAADSLSLPDQTGQDLEKLVEIARAQSRADEVWLVSFAPYAPASETMAYLLDRWPGPAPMWAWISDETYGLDEQAEGALIEQATANRRAAWLWQQPADGSPDLAVDGPLAALAQAGFITGDQQIGETGHLSAFSLLDERPLPAPRPVDRTFGDGLTLTGFTATIERPGGVQVALFWQASPDLSRLLASGDVVASLRLQNEAGQPVVQADRLLVSREYPLQSLAHLGQAGRQGIALDLPPDLAAGPYDLTLQLYHGGSQATIPADNGETVVRLTSLELD
ncbi:MAG: hypothetical protein ACE5H9_05815 [Anaerolineae bacterium]